MNPSERKTFRLMKFVSFGTICAILITLFLIAQYQSEKSSTSLVASTQISLIDQAQVQNIKSFSWMNEEFVRSLAPQKINYINYWAQWCEPCLTEMPHLKKLAETNPQINLIFVNVDNNSNYEKAKKWWANNNLGFNNYYAKYENNILKHTRGLPYHQIYDKSKNLVSHFTGNIEGNELKINNLLKEIK